MFKTNYPCHWPLGNADVEMIQNSDPDGITSAKLLQKKKKSFQTDFKGEMPSGQLGGPAEGDLSKEAFSLSQRAYLAAEGAGKVSFTCFRWPQGQGFISAQAFGSPSH